MEDLDMTRMRISLLIALVIGSSFISKAADIIVPDGVTLLTEEQLLNQVIGNTHIGGKSWIQYYEPGIDNLKEGKIKGDSRDYGLYGGTWSVDGPMMCFKWDLAIFAAYNGCWTTAIDGDNVTWYSARGILHTDPAGQVTLVPDNPNNL
jgi:hypothetical protein